MRAILMSIKPKWVAKILNEEKTIEVRKRFPKNYRGWVYIYCTKGTQLIKYVGDYYATDLFKGLECQPTTPKLMNGKVVARFYCDNVEEILIEPFGEEYKDCEIELCKNSCLSFAELVRYLKDLKGYAIHISKLEIFDKPLPLQPYFDLKRPPQSYQFIYEPKEK